MNFKTSIKGESPWVSASREAFQSKYSAMEWPGKRDEEWRRTKVSLFPIDTLKAPSPSNGSVKEITLDKGTAGKLIFENGALVGRALAPGLKEKGVIFTSWDHLGDWSPFGGLFISPDKAEDKFQAALGASWNTGFALFVPEGLDLGGDLIVEYKELRSDVLSSPFNAVSLGDRSKGRLILRTSSPEGTRSFLNSGTVFKAGESVEFSIFDLQTLSGQSFQIDHSTLSLGKSSKINHVSAAIGAGVTKTKFTLSLDGEGGILNAKGMFFGSEDQHKDIRLVQFHEAPKTTSSALYKGAVKDRAHTVFQGMIEVKPTAPGTDAYLSNKNLILTDGAKAESLPQLKIDTNDVKCSHGATTGKVNEEELFYLMTRGFSKKEARLLISEGLFSEIVEAFPEALRPELEGTVEKAIGGL